MPFPLGQFPPSLREKALDLAVKLLETLREAWLVVLAFFLVCGDPFGRARAPLPISVGAGAGRRMASVCLVQGQSPRALRVAAPSALPGPWSSVTSTIPSAIRVLTGPSSIAIPLHAAPAGP